MPILKNAKKALRVSRRKTEINRQIKSRVKTMVDKMKKDPSQENLSEAYTAIDTAAKKNIFHRNKAARLKSQLSKLMPKDAVAKPKAKPAAKKAAAKPAKKTAPKKAAPKAKKAAAKK